MVQITLWRRTLVNLDQGFYVAHLNKATLKSTALLCTTPSLIVNVKKLTSVNGKNNSSGLKYVVHKTKEKIVLHLHKIV